MEPELEETVDEGGDDEPVEEPTESVENEAPDDSGDDIGGEEVLADVGVDSDIDTSPFGDSPNASDEPGEGSDTPEGDDTLDEDGDLDMEGGGLAQSINDGSARLAVIGLEDEDEKERLQEEFQEVFKEFKLGYYAEETLQEYVLTQDEDVPPVWGLIGAMVMCTTMVIIRRPDGDEVLDSIKERIPVPGSITGEEDNSENQKQIED